MHVEVQRIDKFFGPVQVLRGCSLAMERGEVVTLLGASGCGKSTLLRCIAGFYVPERGAIVVEGRDVTLLPPNKRRVGLVFQSYALFPHMTVWRNVAYGLRVRGVPRAEVERRVADALDLTALGEFADRYPVQLSGGQQQRVAVARALILEPELILLDEPFNALDAKLRFTMQVQLRKLVKRLNMTSIFVTHDQSEALTISDRVAIMRDGVIEQIADPLEIYDSPASTFVADFIGATNLVRRAAAGGRVRLREGCELPAGFEGRASVVVRPENLIIDRPERMNGEAVWRGQVTFVKPQGATVEYEVDVGADGLMRVLGLRRAHESTFALGDAVALALRDPASCVVLPADEAP